MLLRPGGQLVISRDDGQVREYDTATCHHCSTIIIFRPNADIGGFCRQCMKTICGPCADKGSCTPFEEKLAREEEADIRRRALSRILGL